MGATGYDVRLATVEAVPTAVVAKVTTWPEFPSLWTSLLDEVYAAQRQGAITQAGHNVMPYRDDRPSVEVGIEVSGSFPPVAGSCPRRCRRAGWRPPSTAGPTTGWARPTTPSRRGPVGEGHTLTRVRWEVYGDWSDDPTKLETETAWLLA